MKREELLKKVLEVVEGVLSKEAIEEIKTYNEDELKMILDDLEDFNESEEFEEDDELDPERMAGLLACQEEEIRQRRLYEEDMPELSKETLDSELFNDMITMAESVIAGVRVMVEGGIDYANALTICSNYLQNQHNLEMAKIGQVQVDKNQI